VIAKAGVDAAPLCLPPRAMSRRPRFTFPSGAVDTHLHVFQSGAPLVTPRSYTPHVMTLADWRTYARQAGIARGILVQPSVYGFDNSVLLEALSADPKNLRGIAVLDAAEPNSESELEHLNSLGVRGVRCNTRNLGGIGFDAAILLAANIAPLGWTLQFQVLPEQLNALAAILPELGVRIVIDHLGFIDLSPSEEAIDRLRALLETGSCYVKLSAPYRLAGAEHFATVASALLRSHPERLLWGSDWPHTELWDGMPDDAQLIDSLGELLATDSLRRLVLVDTPTSLFFTD
jgi:predicted TIM-barrel fold metal-dependent hydrolase